jgi:hypothetical protein
MKYLAPPMPAVTLAGRRLIGRLERCALTSGLMVAPTGSADTGPLTPTGSGELG